MILTRKILKETLTIDRSQLPRLPHLIDFFIEKPLWDYWKLIKLLRYTDYFKSNEKQLFYRLCYYLYSFRLKRINHKYRTWFFPDVFGAGLRIHHLEVGGITVAPTAKIGKYFTIRQFCTIGYNGNDYTRAAVIDDYVDMSVGACIFGHVKVGRGARIGSYAVVTQNVPPYAIVAGNPAKVVGYTMTPQEIEEFERKRYPEEERIPINRLEKNYNKFFEKREEIADYLRM